MRVVGASLLKEGRGSVKFVLNESGVIFFPGTQQHREMKMEGVSYEDDYRGNAVAGLIGQERVDVRFHQAFSDERIRHLWSRVLQIPEVAAVGLGRLFYQGREIV